VFSSLGTDEEMSSMRTCTTIRLLGPLLFAGVAACLSEGRPSEGASGGDARAERLASSTPANFLVEEGVGSADEAATYYQGLGSEFVPGVYTLDQWMADNMGQRPVHTGFYRNSHELGFWREMTCTKYIGRGIGGCWVRNWNDPGDPAAGKPNLGTVTMSVSPEGLTRFFVFAPDGKLSPFAVLDDEGQKFVPRVCIVCHNGTWDGPSAGSDLHAIFREFEPSLLEGLPDHDAEQEWFDLNQSVRSANEALRTEGEGAIQGLDHARSAQAAYVQSIYTQTSPPVSLAVGDVAHLPKSWAALGDTPTVLAAKRDLWSRVVAPYCMTCHRTNAEDWSDYSQFAPLANAAGGTPFIDLYVAGEQSHAKGLSFMPQAKLLFQGLKGDPLVQPAIDAWVAALGGPKCEPGTTCTPPKLCYKGVIHACDGSKYACTPTEPVPDGTLCGEDRACNRGECIDSLTISIPIVLEGVYVRNQVPGNPEAHVHVSVGGGQLTVAQVRASTPCTDAASQVTMDCNISTLTCTDPAKGDAWKVIAGATLKRTNPRHPELEGVYRIESPVDIDACP
jgi:hypothetical protein